MNDQPNNTEVENIQLIQLIQRYSMGFGDLNK